MNRQPLVSSCLVLAACSAGTLDLTGTRTITKTVIVTVEVTDGPADTDNTTDDTDATEDGTTGDTGSVADADADADADSDSDADADTATYGTTTSSACGGAAPRELWSIEYHDVLRTPPWQGYVANYTGPGTICAVSCDVVWAIGWAVGPAPDRLPLPFPVDLADVSATADLLFEMSLATATEPHEGLCTAHLGDGALLEIVVRQP